MTEIQRRAFLGTAVATVLPGIAGCAFGVGGQDFVAENIDDWAASITDALDEEDDETGGFQYE